MKNPAKHIFKKSLQLMGLDLVRYKNNPCRTFLGLKNLSIRTIFDVGANEGQFAKKALNVFPGVSIFAFEPLLAPFKKLKDWSCGQKGRVSVFNIALGDAEGDVLFHSHVDHHSSSSLLKTTELCESLYPSTKRQSPVVVKSTTLDHVIAGLSPGMLIPEILIKLDVQGYEEHVLKGGIKTLGISRACILEICLDSLYENQARFKDIVDFFYSCDYRYAGNLDQVLSSDGHAIYIDAVFMK